MNQWALIGSVIALLGLAACDTRDFTRRPANPGPDEFSVLPSKPLELPQDLASLPEPTPGNRNLADQLPKEDAVAALGGNPNRLRASGISASEQALVTAASRLGVDPQIRARLDAELDDSLRNPLLFERLFGLRRQVRYVSRVGLDAQAEAERLRRAGVSVPQPSQQ